MSLSRDILLSGAAALHDLSGEPLRLERSRTDFRATLHRMEPVDPRTELGADPREHSMMEVLPPVPELRQGDVISMLDGGAQWRVLTRDDNPADFATSFLVVKITTKDK